MNNLPKIRRAGRWKSVRVVESETGPMYLIQIGNSSLAIGLNQKSWEEAVRRGDAIQAGVVNSNLTTPAAPR